MSLIPILSQFIAFFKVHYTVSHIFGIVNILCILCSFVLSILCIKNRENRNLMNIFSMILSGLFMVIIAVIAFAVVVYAVKGQKIDIKLKRDFVQLINRVSFLLYSIIFLLGFLIVLYHFFIKIQYSTNTFLFSSFNFSYRKNFPESAKAPPHNL